MIDTAGVQAAMSRAVELGRHGPAHGPNPQVGCVIITTSGDVLGEGWHHGAGTPHAEVEALADAAAHGRDVTGAHAVVTLEPCAHTGRTGPCTQALLNAGIGAVTYAVEDPGEVSGGGTALLEAQGVAVRRLAHDDAWAMVRRWWHATWRQRPWVIAKWAMTLDGRMAADDGSSFWITGQQARDHAHRVRADVDAIAVGTGTVLADDPRLSARPGGVDSDHQPLRVIIGARDTSGSQVWRDDNAIAVTSHEPAEVLVDLWRRQVRTLVVEGGPTVLSAFVRAGLVDEINAYIAPALLGAGPSVVNDLGITTMAAAFRAGHVTSTPLGSDTLVTAIITEGN